MATRLSHPQEPLRLYDGSPSSHSSTGQSLVRQTHVLGPLDELETLRSTFQDSDDEADSQRGPTGSKYKLVGRLMRTKAKGPASGSSSTSSPPAPSSTVKRKGSTSRPSSTHRDFIAELEDSIAEFFGTPPKSRSKSKSDRTAPGDTASLDSSSSSASKHRESEAAGKEVRILEEVLGLGTITGSSSSAKYSPAAKKSKLPRENLVTFRRRDSSFEPAQDHFTMVPDPFDTKVVDSPASTLGRTLTPDTLQHGGSATSSPAQRYSLLTVDRSTPPALAYDRSRRPGFKTDETTKAGSTESAAKRSPSTWTAAGARHALDQQAPPTPQRCASPLVPHRGGSPKVSPVQLRSRRGQSPAALPPARPPPSTGLPPAPGTPRLSSTPSCAAVESEPDAPAPAQRAAISAKTTPAETESPRTDAPLSPFRALMTDVRVDQRPQNGSTPAVPVTVMVELNVGGRRFTTSSDTLYAGTVGQQSSRLASFIQSEIDKASLPGETTIAAARDPMAKLQPGQIAVWGRRTVHSRVDRPGFASYESDLHPSPSDSGSSSDEGDSDARTSFSSPYTMIPDSETGNKSVSATSQTSLWSEVDTVVAKLNVAAHGQSPFDERPVAVSRNAKEDADHSIAVTARDDGVYQDGARPLCIVDVEDKPDTPSPTSLPTASARISMVLDQLLAEQHAPRRVSKLNDLCPSDVGESETDEEFTLFVDRFPSPGSRRHTNHNDQAVGPRSTEASTHSRNGDNGSGVGSEIVFIAADVDAADSDSVEMEQHQRRSSAVAPSWQSRRARGASSLQQVPPRSPTPCVPLPSTLERSVARSPSQAKSAPTTVTTTASTVTFLAIFLDRNPKCYAALLDALRDGQLPGSYTMSDTLHERSSRLSSTSSSCSSSSSSSSPHCDAADGIGRTMFKLGNVDSVKQRKTATRLAELRKEAAWLGYDQVVEMCEREQRKADVVVSRR